MKHDKHYVIGQLLGIIEGAKIMRPEIVPALEDLLRNLKALLKVHPLDEPTKGGGR